MKVTILMFLLFAFASCTKSLPDCGCKQIRNAKEKAICEINCR